jgi:hypothetical protein
MSLAARVEAHGASTRASPRGKSSHPRADLVLSTPPH